MLSIKEIEKNYPENMHPFRELLLKEYLQHKILEIIFSGKYADRLSFIGGTCLRIIHGNRRFSEDLDFDHFDLKESDFEFIASSVKKQLQKEGYDVETKNVYTGAYHCYIRFPGLLFNENLSGYKEEKILIQLDTEAQNVKYTPEKFILNKFDVFTSINITAKDLLLSQNIFALLNRKRKKGRDFYDIIFLLKSTRPNYNYLNLKLGIQNNMDLKSSLLDFLKTINLKEMAEDVRPFLFDPDEIKPILLFEDYINQIF
jgi:predicted nucleotidyltransferase component of viral defense system